MAVLRRSRQVKHFEIHEWADYVRGLSDEAVRTAMKKHLETGCRRCQGMAGTFEKLVSTIAGDHSPEVPAHVVHNAEALFAMHAPEKITFAHRIARLVQDSFRTPLPAGVRSQRGMNRQALYTSGDFCIDVRLEHERGAKTVSLTGQLASTKNPTMMLGDVPVALMSGRELLARAKTNEFGEFQLHYEPKGRLRLHLPIKPIGQWIEVPLGEFSEEQRSTDQPTTKRRRGGADSEE
jgi:hypothetical protein